VGDREILETYLNSASKNRSETGIFPHGPKSLLTSVIIRGAKTAFEIRAALYTTLLQSQGFGH